MAFSVPGAGFQETIGDYKTIAEAIENGKLHYGDPPNYGNCRDGASMGCYDLRVLQYWMRASCGALDSGNKAGDRAAGHARVCQVARGKNDLQFSGSKKTLTSLGIHRAMLQKKVCMLGAYGVGKRSLTAGCEAPFAGQYASSVSVRICKKTLEIDGRSVTLLIWDITDGNRWDVVSRLLRGMEGYLLVADGTRPDTVERARDIFEQIWSYVEPQPQGDNGITAEGGGVREQFPYRKILFLLLLNKCDLTKEWKIEKSFLQIFANKGWPVEVVSAKKTRDWKKHFSNSGESIESDGGEIAALNRNKIEVKGLRSCRSRSDREGPELRNTNLGMK